jgi:adenylate cyclase
LEIFKELRRRKVIRVALVYIVTAWLLIQVAGEVSDPLHLPAWFATAVIVLLALGFPVALGLAWAFEVKPNAPDSGDHTEPDDQETNAEEYLVTRRSIAILPLENLSDESRIGHFANGLTEEVLNRLSALKDLKVASRSSTLAYRDLNQNTKLVGEELGVSYLLEGSVRQASEALRLTIQLIRAPDDEHIWAQSFELAIDDGFEAQEKLAKSVAHRAHANVIADVSILATRRQTQSARAYRHFRIAAEERWQGVNSDKMANLKLVYDNFRLATEIDPEFAAAHEGVANASLMWRRLDITREEASSVAHAAMRRSLELRPPSGYSYMVLGMVYNQLDANLPAARQALTQGLAIAPNIAWLHGELAATAIREGKVAEALEEIRTAAKLSPGDRRINQALGVYLFLKSDFSGAIATFEEVLERAAAGNDYVEVSAWSALALMQQDNLERANAILDTALKISEPIEGIGVLALALAQAGRTLEGAEIKAKAVAKHGDHWFTQRFLLHLAVGEMDEAFDNLHQSIDKRRDSDLRFLRTDTSFLSEMRADPRWSNVVAHLDDMEASAAAEGDNE